MIKKLSLLSGVDEYRALEPVSANIHDGDLFMISLSGTPGYPFSSEGWATGNVSYSVLVDNLYNSLSAINSNILSSTYNYIDSVSAEAVKFTNNTVLQEHLTGSTAPTLTGGWNKRNLNTMVVSGIDGASLSNGELTLPSGTYKIKAFGGIYVTGSSSAGSKLGLYNETDGVFIAYGSGSVQRDGGSGKSILTYQFTINDTKTIILRQYLTSSSYAGGASVNSGEPDDYTVYSEAELWKIG